MKPWNYTILSSVTISPPFKLLRYSPTAAIKQSTCLVTILSRPFRSFSNLSLLSLFFWSTGSVYCNTLTRNLHPFWRLSWLYWTWWWKQWHLPISHHSHCHRGSSPGPRGGSAEHLEWGILHQVWWCQLLRLETKKHIFLELPSPCGL